MSPGTPLSDPDQTAALQLGHFATNSVLGSHVARMLAGTGTEADPGLPGLTSSEAVRNDRSWLGPVRLRRRAGALGL
jgi:hypothetical protein